MAHDFKVGDIAVVIHSENGNTGKMVRITENTYESEHGHDLVAKCLDATGLAYTVGYENDDGEIEELEFKAMEIAFKSKNLHKLDSHAALRVR